MTIPKPTILVVDDQPDFVKTIRDRLDSEGFETCVAYEGIRALEMANKKKPDLIILDVKMPAGDGLTVLKNIRSREETRQIPVIVLTGFEEEGLEERSRKAGADFFLKKPYDLDLLIGKIQTLLPG